MEDVEGVQSSQQTPETSLTPEQKFKSATDKLFESNPDAIRDLEQVGETGEYIVFDTEDGRRGRIKRVKPGTEPIKDSYLQGESMTVYHNLPPNTWSGGYANWSTTNEGTVHFINMGQHLQTGRRMITSDRDAKPTEIDEATKILNTAKVVAPQKTGV